MVGSFVKSSKHVIFHTFVQKETSNAKMVKSGMRLLFSSIDSPGWLRFFRPAKVESLTSNLIEVSGK